MSSKIDHVGPKVPKSDAKRYPKVSQKSSKWTWLDLSKHMAVTTRMPLWATSGEVGWRLFSCLLSAHPLFTFFCNFGGFGSKNGAKWGRYSAVKWSPFSPFSSKWPKWSPRGATASKKTPKWSPRVPKWSPEASQIEVVGLKTVVKKGRAFRPFRQSTTHTTRRKTL